VALVVRHVTRLASIDTSPGSSIVTMVRLRVR